MYCKSSLGGSPGGTNKTWGKVFGNNAQIYASFFEASPGFNGGAGVGSNDPSLVRLQHPPTPNLFGYLSKLIPESKWHQLD